MTANGITGIPSSTDATSTITDAFVTSYVVSDGDNFTYTHTAGNYLFFSFNASNVMRFKSEIVASTTLFRSYNLQLAFYLDTIQHNNPLIPGLQVDDSTNNATNTFSIYEAKDGVLLTIKTKDDTGITGV